MPPDVAIAVSGGVDSMTAAWLLKSQGFSLVGIHFVTGYESTAWPPDRTGEEISRRLQIPVTVMDISASFQERVVDYFAATYAKGKTPNPCLVCNHRIKFGLILEAALAMGAKHLATGHYVQNKRNAHGIHYLARGVDPAKDQSYFLARLDQKALAKALFPLGEMTKDRVRQLAADQNLTPVFTGESQDVCFIPRKGYADFLKQLPGFSSGPGPMVDTSGNILGRHRGLAFYTVGQRRGLNLPAKEPYYVIRLEPDKNRLVIGFREQLFAAGCRVGQIRWASGAVPSESLSAHVQIRYRSPAAPAVITPVGPDRADIAFQSPQKAITPGQGAVFYVGDQVMGSGWIDAPISEKT